MKHDLSVLQCLKIGSFNPAMFIVAFVVSGLFLLTLPLYGEANFNPPRYGYAPTKGKVTSPFGWRTHPISGSKKFHRGVDIGAGMGTPVYSPQAGMVVYSGAYSGYGNVVVVYHGNDVFTLYGHLNNQYVQKGQRVNQGELLAAVGSSGRSTGPHLHFEVHQSKQYVDPLKYLAYVQNWPAMQEAPVRSTKHSALKKQYKGIYLGQNKYKNNTGLIQITQMGKKANINGNKVGSVGTVGKAIQATVSRPAIISVQTVDNSRKINTGNAANGIINVLATTDEMPKPVKKAAKAVQKVKQIKNTVKSTTGATGKVELLMGTTAEYIDFE